MILSEKSATFRDHALAFHAPLPRRKQRVQRVDRRAVRGAVDSRGAKVALKRRDDGRGQIIIEAVRFDSVAVASEGVLQIGALGAAIARSTYCRACNRDRRNPPADA